MKEDSLPFCCVGGEWIVRDSARRYRELIRRGFSSLPRIAVCSKCGNTKFIDPGVPDAEFIRRRSRRNQRRNDDDKFNNSTNNGGGNHGC